MVFSVVGGAFSSPSASSSSAAKTEKLLQVDIFLLNAPHAENGQSAENGSDELERLARQFGTAALFDGSIALRDDRGPAGRGHQQCCERRHVRIDRYRDGRQLPDIMRLIGSELSEPYSFYTYLYFTHQWPELCVLAVDCDSEAIVGAVLCKMEDQHLPDYAGSVLSRGYIAMLAVEETYRGHGLGIRLVRTVIEIMREKGCHEVVLETEVTNARSLSLYGRLGFIRDARLSRYYLNGGDAFRLKLFLEQADERPDGTSVADGVNTLEGGTINTSWTTIDGGHTISVQQRRPRKGKDGGEGATAAEEDEAGQFTDEPCCSSSTTLKCSKSVQNNYHQICGSEQLPYN
ncbi:hypothetical protein GPALN_014590 [Globodera pallida]|nr:hypothetical protein GPALN_014590 [Globodera pallida]